MKVQTLGGKGSSSDSSPASDQCESSHCQFVSLMPAYAYLRADSVSSVVWRHLYNPKPASRKVCILGKSEVDTEVQPQALRYGSYPKSKWTQEKPDPSELLL